MAQTEDPGREITPHRSGGGYRAVTVDNWRTYGLFDTASAMALQNALRIERQPPFEREDLLHPKERSDDRE